MNDARHMDNFIVPAPFDMNSPGDCYLESAEGHRFKVYRIVLSLASPVFRDMFTLPQPSDRTRSDADLPIVPMSEDAHTIHRLLLLIYPPAESDPPAFDIDRFVSLVAAHEKYDISQRALRHIHRDLWQSPDYLSSHGIEMYAAAWRLGLEPEAKIASRYTHTVDLENRVIARNLTARSGSVDALVWLMKMRRLREEALDRVISGFDLRTSLCPVHGGNPPTQFETFDSRKRVPAAPESYYWIQVAKLKTKFRRAVSVPYPKCTETFRFLGISAWTSIDLDSAGRSCSGRSCWEKPAAHITINLVNAVGNYPQEIPGFESLG